MAEILSCENVFKSYPLGQSHLEVLKGASVSINEGEFVAIIGASGSGKSTLLHILGALDRPSSGTVRFRDCDMTHLSGGKLDKYRNINVGFVFQFYHLVEELSVLENILMPAMARHTLPGWWANRKKYTDRAVALADRLGLSARLKHRPSQLSGGERQRAAIGRAIINRPDVLLADEPTGNLDWNTGCEILDILKEFHKSGQSIVMVTHDVRIAEMADRVIMIQDGIIL